MDLPYPKINYPKVDNLKSQQRLNQVFGLLSNYLNIIKYCIFKEVKFIQDRSDEKFMLCRIQMFFSSVLYRSIYIRNGIVDSINSKNPVSLFANLKVFMEVSAVLAYILSLLKEDLLEERLFELVGFLTLGNRGEGDLLVGKNNAINVMKMFDKLDAFIKSCRVSVGSDEKIDTVMSQFYSQVCNASHPNYDAHDVTSTMEAENELWRCLSPDEIRKRITQDYEWFSPPLVLTITTIEALCNEIMQNKKIDFFKKLNNPLLVI